MSSPPYRQGDAEGKSASGFLRFMMLGLLWLVVGVLAGRYLYPEVRIETVERRVEVEKRVEVPVERVVERVVIKEVEKRVEVPVEKIVIREVQVPAPTPQVPGIVNQAKATSAWDGLKAGMTKSEVTELLGEPNRVVTGEDFIYWYYSAQRSDFLFIRFKVAGFIGFDRVEYWMGPNQRTPKR